MALLGACSVREELAETGATLLLFSDDEGRERVRIR